MRSDGRQAATAISDRTVKLYDLETLRATSAFRGHTERISTVCYHPSMDHVLLSSSEDATMRMWDERAGAKPVSTLALRGPSSALTISGDHRASWGGSVAGTRDVPGRGSIGRLVAVGMDATIGFWDMRVAGDSSEKPPSLLAVYEEGHIERVTQLQFHPFAPLQLLSASEEGLVCHYDTMIDGESDALQVVLQADSAIDRMGVFGSGGSHCFCVTQTQGLYLWHLGSAELVGSFLDLRDRCAASGIDCCTLIDCHYDTASEALSLLGGSWDSGTGTLFDVQPSTVTPLARLAAGDAAAAAEGGEKGASGASAGGTGGHGAPLRCVDWIPAAAVRRDSERPHSACCVTGGEDGRLCVWGDGEPLGVSHAPVGHARGGPRRGLPDPVLGGATKRRRRHKRRGPASSQPRDE